MSRFIKYYKKYKKLFIQDMICALTVALITLIYPLLIRYITTDVLVNNEIEKAVKSIMILGAGATALAIVEMLAKNFITNKGHMMGAYMEADMRNELFDHYQKLSFSFYDNQKTGQLMSRITNDLFDVTELAHHGPEDLVISIIKFIGAFIILMMINIPLTLIIFAFLPVMFTFAMIMKKKMHAASKVNRARIADVNASIEDNLSGIREVQSFANEAMENEKFAKGNNRFILSKASSYYYMGIFHSGLGFFISMLNIAVLAFGGIFIAKNIIEMSDLLTFVLYINNLIEPINKLINFTEQFQNGITGFERFCEMMDIEPEIKDSDNAIDAGELKGKIVYDNVSFRYSDGVSNVLSNINITVNQGEYVAIAGLSGMGKSTLLNLLPRFYDVTSGNITIDGINVKNMTLYSLRRNIGIVAQDVYLFAGTILENIRYGKPDATMEEVIEAAKNANAHDFIMSYPDGYNTYIGQRGVKMSGGQKQRISITRVFLKNPSILIFDEATSSLDNESERIVKESMEKLVINRTTLVIAHRLSTIKNADRILVLGEKGIEESGTHKELLEKGGIYAGLYEMTTNC